MKVLFENKWCKIVSKDTFYILKSKEGKYNDRYSQTVDAAFKAIGMPFPVYKKQTTR